MLEKRIPIRILGFSLNILFPMAYLKKIIRSPSAAILKILSNPPRVIVPRTTITTMLRNMTITCQASV